MTDPRPSTAAARRLPSRSQGLGVFLVMMAVRLLVIGGAALVLQVLGNGAGGVTHPTRDPFVSDPLWLVTGTLAGEIATLAVVIGSWFVIRPTFAAVAPLRIPRSTGIVGALLVTFGVMPLAELAAALVGALSPHDSAVSDLITGTVHRCTPGQFVLLLIGLAAVPAFVEEAAFRGFITAAFHDSPVRALWLPSVLFGVFHLDPRQAAATTVLGVAFGLARLATQSLVTSMIAHAVYNGVVLLVLYSAGAGDASPSALRVSVGLAVALLGVALLHREARSLEGTPPSFRGLA